MNIQIEDWGLIDYMAAYERQKVAVSQIIGGGESRLVFCEHPPVLTLGRMTNPDSLLYTKDDILARGVSIYPIDRGGDVTLHAPGQLVVYPLIDLNLYSRDLKSYMERLEQVAVDLLTDFGILAVSVPGQRGVFVGRDKIVSIGVGVRKWITYHGLGINVNTDLSLFRLIKPCGLSVEMTSMQKLKGQAVDMAHVKANVIKQFEKLF
jgi:lipoate-protein ligase B